MSKPTDAARIADFCNANPEKARAIFDAALATETDPTRRAWLLVSKAYLTKPEARTWLAGEVWEQAKAKRAAL